MDVFSRRKRSEVMARIRGKGNKSTERRMSALLRANRISGWKLHPQDVLGKPDIFFPRLKIAIFLDGCFWHACKKCFQMPRQNRAFWARKFQANVRRDRHVSRALNRQAIKVVRLWEHDLKKRTARLNTVLRTLQALHT